MWRVERQPRGDRATVVVLGLAAILAVWPTSGRAQDFVWDYSCTPDTGWYQVCGVDTCAGGTETLYGNNWGRTACGTNPAFPGAGDRSVIGADFDATLSADAAVSALELDGTATLFVDGVGTALVVGSDLDITGSTAELRFFGGSALTFQGATITNQGVVRLGQSSPPTSYLTCPGPVGLAGAGHLTFAGYAYVTGVGPLTNGAGHTIDGGGADIQAPLVNDGVVSSNAYAGVILLSTSPKVNNGTLTASAAGNLDIATQVTQGATGQITPGDSGEVRMLDGAHVIGGTTTSTSNGLIYANGTSFEVTDITNSGSWLVENGATMAVSGSALTNTGTIQLRSSAATATNMDVRGNVTASGSGAIFLSGGGSLTTGIGATLTNAVGHTIHGSGSFIHGAVDNYGAITGDYTTGTALELSTLPKTNHGFIGTTAGAGRLGISTTVTQSGSGQIAAGGDPSSSVQLLDGAEIIGGTVNGADGQIQMNATSATVTDITAAGSWLLAEGATLSVSGSALTNNGTIQVIGGAGGPATLQVGADVSLSGSGTVQLGGGILQSAGGTSFTNAEGHTIRGSASTIAASLVNRGLVMADSAFSYLTVTPLPPGLTNEGRLEVSSGCNMTLNSASLFSQTAGETVVNGPLYVNGAPLALAGGDLTGNNTIHGSVVNTGATVSPGSPLGRFWIQDGGYTQGSDAHLLIELGGTAWDTYDRLEVSGAVTLAGTLYVTNANGYAPTPGQSWPILTASSITGQFDHVQSWADSDCSLGFTVTYNASSVAITAVDGTANIFCSNFEAGTTAGWFHTVP